MSDTPTRGRRPIYANDDERAAAKKRGKERVKNVTIDADLVEALNSMANDLESKFGFRPTLSQTVRYLIKNNPLANETPAP
ncbi:MAG TPA: hypothetical protein VM867_08315 [Xanthobacteraceae bacterium]|nr:hypothetical protein [Xanthobacteraceae bacterium]